MNIPVVVLGSLLRTMWMMTNRLRLFRSALLALLVALPPGSFRSLDHVMRDLWGIARPQAPAASGAKSPSDVPRCRPSVPPVAPPQRSWDQLTFKSAAEGDCDAARGDPLGAALWTTVLVADGGLHRAREGTAPPLNAHSTSRGALIALQHWLN